MIEFDYVLPRFYVGEKRVGQYNNPEMVLPCILTTESYNLGEFLHIAHNTVADDRRLVFVDGKTLVCCNNWIRDHVHMLKATKHYEYELKSFIDFMISKQSKEGYYFELIKQIDDSHWQYVNSDCYKLYKCDGVSLVRLELEADIEYLMVEGAKQYYKASGDIRWIKKVLKKLEKGIDYITSNPKRWSEKYGLVIRPYTIDTWDFTSAENTGTDRRIHDDEKMCAMHGDNSGVYSAMKTLAEFNRLFGNDEKATEWENRADALKQKIFKYLWNGKFFVHQFPINCEPLDDKEKIRLSLSNAYDINRGITDLYGAFSIIEEYIKRRESTPYFSEWFSIDPPYEKFGKFSKGDYVNGAISPFTAGELCLAAFNNGYEKYAYDILCRMVEIVNRDKRVNFLYNVNGVGGQNETGPSGWGAAALINAVDEGLAGIVDKDCLYREIDFSPKFAVTEYKQVRYITGYERRNIFVELHYTVKDEGMRYDLYSPAKKVNADILLPENKRIKKLLVNGKEKNYELIKKRESVYVRFSTVGEKRLSFEIIFISDRK